MAFIKRLVAWLFLSLPVGIGVGALVSAFVPEDAAINHGLAAVNGALAGGQLALLGALVAATTTTLTRGTLRRAGGSEAVTGAIISYGLIVIGLLALLLL